MIYLSPYISIDTIDRYVAFAVCVSIDIVMLFCCPYGFFPFHFQIASFVFFVNNNTSGTAGVAKIITQNRGNRSSR